MKKINPNSTTDQAHIAIISYLTRYYKFREYKDYPLGIIKEDGTTPTEFIVLNCTQSGDRYIINTPFIRDVLHVRMPCTIGALVISDKLMSGPYRVEFNKLVDEVNRYTTHAIPHIEGLAHRDAIQLIPAKIRYAGGLLRNVTIVDNTISSEGALQPIFASDGAFEGLSIRDNIIDTQSQHKISISGMLSGEISGNVDGVGNKIDAVLRPLRLGGGKLNINVISFHPDCNYQYRVIKGVDRRNDFRSIAVSNRPYVEYLNTDVFHSLYNNQRHERMNRFIRIDHVLRVMHSKDQCYYSKMIKK